MSNSPGFGSTPFDRPLPDKVVSRLPVTLKHLAAAVVVIALPWLLGPGTYYVYLVDLALVYGLAAMGLNVLTGVAGQISIGHGGFLAVGAFTSARLTMAGVPFPIALVGAGLLAAGLGLIMGLPALRLHGHYLAIATLGFGIAVVQILNRWEGISGGFQGIHPPAPTLLGLALASERGYYYLALLVCVLVGTALRNLLNSRTGRAWRAVRDSETAAQAMGVSLTWAKGTAFAVSAFCAGLAGSLYGHLVRFISAHDFGIAMSLNLLAMIVLGGLGSLGGALAGSAFVVALPPIVYNVMRLLPPEMSRFTRGVPQVLMGLALILVVLYLPGGLASLPRLAGERWLGLSRQKIGKRQPTGGGRQA